MLGKRLELFVIHTVDIKGANTFGTGKRTLFGHRWGGNELAVFPVPAFGCNLANIDLGIEISCERVAVIATVYVDDV